MVGEFVISKKEDILTSLYDYKVEIHTNDEKGYEFLEIGEFFITIKNPEGASNLSIKLGATIALYFGGWNAEYQDNEEGYEAFKETMKAILDCTKCVYCLKFADKSLYVLEKVLADCEDNEKTVKRILADIEEFKRVKFRGARLRLISWQTEYNKEFCL